MLTIRHILFHPGFLFLFTVAAIALAAVLILSCKHRWRLGKWSIISGFVLTTGLAIAAVWHYGTTAAEALRVDIEYRSALMRSLFAAAGESHGVTQVKDTAAVEEEWQRMIRMHTAPLIGSGSVIRYPIDPPSQLFEDAMQPDALLDQGKVAWHEVDSPNFNGWFAARLLENHSRAGMDRRIFLIQVPQKEIIAAVRDAQNATLPLFLCLYLLVGSACVSINWARIHLRQQRTLIQQLGDSNRLLGNILDSGAAAIGVADQQGKLTRVNQRWGELFGSHDMQGCYVLDLITPEERTKAQLRCGELLKGSVGRYAGQLRLLGPNAEPFQGEVFVSALLDEQQQVIGLTYVVLDISDRKRMEASLIHRDRLLTGLADSLTRLLEYQPRIADNLTEALAAVGWASAVDRAYIFEEHEDLETRESLISMRFEWCDTGIAPQLGTGTCDNVPWQRTLPRWRERLAMNMEIAVNLDLMDYQEIAVLAGQDIQSLLLVPIFIEDKLWGFAGFDDCHSMRRWTDTEISILRAAAKGFGIALQRERTEASLILAKERAEMLNQKLSEENLRTADLAKAAREANETKSRFLANMSHEIRTPMNGVMGMCSVLGGTDLTDEQAEYLAIIRKSATGLLGIIEDILDFSKIEAGKLELDYEEVGLVELVEDALDLFSHTTKQKGMMLLHHIDPRVPARISIDPTRLRQILINLIGNAVKFSPDGYVIVRVWKLPNPMGRISLYFEVEDTGPGIHPEMRPHLFESFNQLNSSLARKFGGTGLGLSISRKLSQMMGGDLRLIKSDERGTTFRGFVQAESLSCAWPETARSLEPAATSTRILLIDKHPFSRGFHEDRFRSLGAPISSCANFEEALSDYKDRGFDVVIVNDPLAFACNGALPQLTTWPQQPRLGVILTSVGEQRDLVWQGPRQVEYRMKPFRSFSVLHYARPESASPSPRRIETGRSSAPPEEFSKALSNHPIWVVDDNAVNLKVASLMLKRLGLTATTFASGEEAIKALGDPSIACPAIIFMDLQMPGLNGLETTQQILSMSLTQLPYVIAMTAAATVEDRENCHEAGMRDFVPKPVKEKELLRVFQTFILQTPEQQSA